MSASDIFIAPGDRPGARSHDDRPQSLSLPKLRVRRDQSRRDQSSNLEQPQRPQRAAAPAKPKPKRKPRRPPLFASLLTPMQKLSVMGVGVIAVITGGLVLWHSGAPQRLARATSNAIWATTSDMGFSVSDISVVGRDRTSPEDILTALDAKTGTPILSVNLADAKARLEAIPSIRTAVVERRLPHALRITLIERRPVALWQHDGAFMLVDKEGRQIPGPIDGYEHLPLVVGDGAPIASTELFALLAHEPAIASRVKAAVRVGSRRWNLRLDDAVKGLEARLPEDDEAAAALHHLAELEKDHGLTDRHITMVDLRLPDRLVVRTGQDQSSHQDQAAQSADPAPSTRRPGG